MIDSNKRDRLKRNWNCLEREVRELAVKHGRDPGSITIIGVSKYVDAATTLALVEAGCVELGESRPQSLWEKADSLTLGATIRWHLIGHLQRNKVRRTIRHQPVIHSIDSERLLTAVADEAASQDREASVLLEVNISGDEAKTGFKRDELAGLLERLPPVGVRVLGLMAMAGRGTSSSDASHQFDQTRELRDQLARQSGHPLAELSMGMSGDFPEAIAAGATLLRIGSRLFEGLNDCE
jgi:pyridoxal phosphate enzyme (YggS family)